MKKIITGNYHLVKNLNSHIVLNLIRSRGPIYGADLAKITGLRSSTVMKILQNLELNGLIVKTGIGSSTPMGGRRPTFWEINCKYGYIIGIKIELNEVQGVLVDLKANVLQKTQLATPDTMDSAAVLEVIKQIVAHLLESQKLSYKRVLGLGIGISGAVDFAQGVIIKTFLLRDTPMPLRALLEKCYPFPIYIENDANAAVLSEKWFNKDRAESHLLYVLLVIDQNVFGIGYGIILENQLYRGAHMLAGESSGHPVTIKQLLDRISAQEEDSVALNGVRLRKDKVTLQDLLQAAANQEEPAMRYFDQVGRILGEELAKAVDMLDPKEVLLGGEVTKAGEHLLAPLTHALHAHSILGDIRKPTISIVSWQQADPVALGAASLVLSSVFQNSDVFRMKAQHF